MLQLRIETPLDPNLRRWQRDALERELGTLAVEREEDDTSLCYRLSLFGPNLRYSRFVAFDVVRLSEDKARGIAILTLGVRNIGFVVAGFSILLLAVVLAGGRIGAGDFVVALLGPPAIALWMVGGSYLAVRRWWLIVAG